MEKSIQESIKATQTSFEKSFKEEKLYNLQTQDDAHLQKILDVLQIKQGDTVLDIGTGTGYLAFAMAELNHESHIVGLDIVENTLKDNRKRAARDKMDNIEFVCYDGTSFPFSKEQFDFAATRYALHHFPQIAQTFREISRVLKKNGVLFLSDPTPNADDEDRFVDDYMRMKKDGHIKYYTKEEFEHYANMAGLKLIQSFQTQICFPRWKESAIGFEEIVHNHKKEIIAGYHVQLTEDENLIYITQNVWNLLFIKE